ncbi:MAG: hypothetical protein ACI89L_000064 [Phycisphaerales bacterium]|jgi:hypothetical protein
MRRTIVTTRLSVLALLLGAMASIGMHAMHQEANTGQAAGQPSGQAAGPVAAEPQYRFQAFDLYIEATSDDGSEPGLAAWQVEFVGTSDKGDVLLVGIEGGEGGEGGADAAYASPAHYDPAAMAGSRVILAAYTLDPDAPRGKTRVARLHLRVPMNTTNDELNNDVKLMAAGDAGGARLTGKAWVEPMPAATEPSELTEPGEPSELIELITPNIDNVKNSGANAPSEG